MKYILGTRFYERRAVRARGRFLKKNIRVLIVSVCLFLSLSLSVCVCVSVRV